MRSGIVVVASLSVLVAVAGCGAESDSGTESASAATSEAASAAVVLVEGVYEDKTTQVTGVVFERSQGLVHTAIHAMENAPRINVQLPDGRRTRARQVARAQCHDLAVLRLDHRLRGMTAMKLGDSSETSVGEPLTTMTYLLEQSGRKGPAFTRVQGTVSALDVREAFPPLPSTGPFIAHQTPLLASASGSPVLDARGQMVGLNTLVAHPRDPDLPGIEFALSSNYIRKRLDQLRPGRRGALGGWGSEHSTCHAALHKLINEGHTHEGPVPYSAPGK